MLGQTMEEGTITKWLKNEGDQVTKGESLLEVMTDKVNMEVEATESGILRKILAQADEVVPVLAPIAIIGTEDEPIDQLLASGTGQSEPSPSGPVVEATQILSAPALDISDRMTGAAGGRVMISPRARKFAETNGVEISALAGRGTGPGGRIVEADVAIFLAEMSPTATPLATKVAAEKGVDLREVIGTGPRGKITRDDVLSAYQPAPVSVAANAEFQVIPFTGMRKIVADNVARSAQTAPHVTLTAEVDMTEAVKLRSQIVDAFEKKYGVRFTFTHLLVKATAAALREHPIVNASLQGNEIRIPNTVNMGIAVPLEAGLIVPVIRNAESKSVAQIAIEMKGLVAKAKSGTLSPPEISEGTFTISNLGAYGIDTFTPIITPGQSAILGVCRIIEKPVVIKGEIVVRSMMNLCVSFDHRVMDGAPVAQFLKTLRDLLESPWLALI
jgi:pyruvate dehydrogenase E2 component (dihydrolipoamide acetyltransferase)